MKSHWIVLIFMGTLVLDYVLMTTSAGTFYEKIYIRNAIRLQSSASHIIVHKGFHTCSLKSKCNYVVEDLAGQIKIYNAKSEIPAKEELMGIWMKKISKLFNFSAYHCLINNNSLNLILHPRYIRWNIINEALIIIECAVLQQ